MNSWPFGIRDAGRVTEDEGDVCREPFCFGTLSEWRCCSVMDSWRKHGSMQRWVMQVM